MKITEEHYKNSNTGEMIKKVSYASDVIKGIPDGYYGIDKQPIENPDLTGFVLISEKKFLREQKKLKKDGKN
jgi:hypothetical protein